MALDTIRKNILLSSELFKEEKLFWSDQLSTASNLTTHSLHDFDTDKKGKYKKSVRQFAVPVLTNNRIQKITKQSQMGYYMVFVSAINMILENHVNGEQISIGIPVVTNEEDPEEHLSKLLPLSLSPAQRKEQSYIDYLSELMQGLQLIDKHKNIPIEFIQEQLGLERVKTYRETFHAAVMLEGVQDRQAMEQLQLDLLVVLEINDDTTTIEIIYNANLFYESTIERLERQLTHVLGIVSAEPRKALVEIDLIDSEDQAMILHEFNDTRRKYPSEKSIVELFEEQCNDYPMKSALVYQGGTMSYQQLNERANQIARVLQMHGVNQETIVGITLDQGMERFAAILGILKAGGAFLPIDETYPATRTEYMLKDSQAKLLVTSKDQNQDLDFNGEIITLTDHLLEPMEKSNLQTYPTANNLAYIMYTSGSTGNPKGVMVEHRNIVRLIKGTTFIDLKETDRMLQGSTIVFDASTLEIWGALLNGMELHLVDKETILDPMRLESKLIDDEITIMWMTTPLFNQISQDSPTMFQGLRYLLVGGDALSVEPIEKVRNVCPDLQLINGYGPTENTTFSTTYHIDQSYQKTIPIGKPISNSTAYILDVNQKLQPIGAVGEIYVGGDGVARGYINNESLNKEKFIDNPFSKGGRLYRTGDLGRWLADGSIEFLGRRDDQVKIRGFRIEIKEVEAVLTQHPYVREAVVLIQERKNDKYISAYVILEEEGNIQAIHETVKKRLPEYMQPSYILVVDDIPLTINGKVDKAVLQKKELEATSSTFVKPTNELEATLLTIWQDIFQIEQISLHDNFYELGGNSLIAIKIISNIRDQLNAQCQVADVLIHATIKDFANFIGKIREEVQFEEVEAITGVASNTNIYEASALQQRIYMVDVMKKAGISYNIPLFIKAIGVLNKVALEKAANQLVRRHESLRTSFQWKEHKLYQVIAPYQPFTVSFKRVSPMRVDSEMQRFVRPFDLKEGPLFRMEVLEISSEESIIMVDVHHSVSDGRSTEIIIDELIKSYSGKKLEKLEYQYKDFSELQKRKMVETNDEENEAYWQAQVGSGDTLVEFPTDYEASPIQTFRGAEVKMEINKNETVAMEVIAKRQKVTDYVLYLSLIKLLLAKFTQQKRVTIASPSTHRDHANWESVVGMFVNMIPINSEVQSEKTVTDFIKQVRTQVLGAHRHMDYGFDKLVEKLGGTRSSGDNPIFNVTFDMHHHEIGKQLESNSIHFELLDITNHTSKFDLSIVAIKKETGVQFVFQYNSSLFKRQSMEQLASYFYNIITQFCENPSKKVAEITLGNQKEEEVILHQFNDTRKDYPRNHTVKDLFEEQCNLHPTKTALIYQGERMNYQQLNERANQVGHVLKAHGLKRGTVVGMTLKQGFARFAAILGIIKAGGVFLPIDNEYPDKRKEYMLENSGAKLLITDSTQNEELPFTGDIITLTEERLHTANRTNLSSNIDATSLAYIMYTSGSTGNPKGVMVEHRNIVRLVKNTDFISFQESDRMLQGSAIVFDASTFEIWGALLNGLELYLVDKELMLNARKLERKIIQDQITIMWMTAPLFNQISKQNPSMFKELRYLLIGGDALSIGPVEKVRQACPNLTIVNGYGPTENTTFSTTHIIDKQYSKTIPIGKPITNSTAYILDANQNVQPIFAVGEIYVGGDGVAKGYCNNELLSKEKFIANPFVVGERLYQTGDLARWLPDGSIEFLGRTDDQIKIRGFRIEIGEIEKALNEHPFVKETVVLVKEGKEKDKQIQAYVVLTGKEETIQTIKLALRKKLPDYMQPSVIIPVDEIPLTINGKVDRACLAKQTIHKVPEYESQEELSTEVEDQLAEIWKSILESENVGLDDNFFEIGGNSILLVSMYEEIMDLFQEVEIDIADLFANPTISSLAEFIDTFYED